MTVDRRYGLRFQPIQGSEEIAAHGGGRWFKPSHAHAGFAETSWRFGCCWSVGSPSVGPAR